MIYKDAYGDSQMVKRTSEGFESAAESLAKLELAIDREKQNKVLKEE